MQSEIQLINEKFGGARGVAFGKGRFCSITGIRKKNKVIA